MEQTNLIESEAFSRFSLNRFMLHNSAKSTIISLDVNVNTYIVSGNGEGKTATMNAVQIGFLPWNNFIDSKKKFHFIDSRGNPYSDMQSYDFYFPEENSFMLFEFTNPHGTFTQIVYRSADNLGINRAFVPLSIDDVYDWFWTFDKEKEMDEIGYPSRISLAGLKEKMKSVKGVQYARKIADAKRIMYNGSLTQSEGRYSIAHIDSRNIDNLVDIFRLTAKASSISDEKIKEITISLINNSYIDNRRDRLNIKPQELLSAFESLKRESNALAVRENARVIFDQITAAYQSMSQTSAELTSLSNTVYQSAKAVLSKETALVTQGQNRAQHVQNKINHAELQEKALNGDIAELGGQIKTHEEYAKSNKQAMHHYEWLRHGTVPGRGAGDDARFKERSGEAIYDTDDEAVKALLEDRDEKANDLVLIRNAELQHTEYMQAKRSLDECNNEISNKRSRIERIEAQTGIHTCEAIQEPRVLVAIHKAFEALDNDVLEQHAGVLNAFAGIFVEDGGNLTVSGDNNKVSFGIMRDHVETVESLERDIEELEASARHHQKTLNHIASIMGSRNQQGLACQIARLETEIENINTDVKIITRIGPNYDAYKAKATLIENLKGEREEKRATLNEVKQSLADLRAEKESIDTQRREHESRRQGAENIVSAVVDKLREANYQRDLEQAEPVKHKLAEPTLAHVEQVQAMIDNIKQSKVTIKMGLKQMVDKNIISDPDNLLYSSDEHYAHIHEMMYKRLVSLYQELEDEKRMLTDQIRTHTDMTIEISEVLESQMRHYNGMVHKLNDTLSRFNITNIDGMRLSITMSETVKAFVKQISSSGLQGTDTDMTSADTIFQYVHGFIEAMNIADNKAFTLSAKELIESIELQFLVAGKWTTTTGSNGQTLVSTAVLLSLFIEHICGRGIQLSVPINVDEISTVDQNNIRQLADFMAEKRLVLFSASPEISFGHEGIFENYISFDDSKVYDPDIILSANHFVVMHHFFGSMYQPSALDEDFDVDAELTGEVSVG